MNGYLYFAYGKRKFFDQAVLSANSLRAWDKDAVITCITNGGHNDDVFDMVLNEPHLMPEKPEDGGFDKKYEGKMLNLWRSTYNRTMVVDSDTFFLDDPSGE